MASFEFTGSHLGAVYGVVQPKAGHVVELDADFAADGVRMGVLKPVEPPQANTPKKPRKA